MKHPPGGKVAVLAKIPALPGKRDELVAALQTAIDNANSEEGTLLYILHTDDKDPTRCTSTSCTTDQAAFDRPRHQRRVQGARQSLRDLAGGRPELTILTPVVGKGL